MNNHSMIPTLFTLAVLYVLSVISLKWVLRQRAMAGLVKRPCPGCRQTYGPQILDGLRTVRYQWKPMRGASLPALDAPRSTFLVKCPHCKIEQEVTGQGSVFIHPQSGILHFQRVVNSPAKGLAKIFTEPSLHPAIEQNPHRVKC